MICCVRCTFENTVDKEACEICGFSFSAKLPAAESVVSLLDDSDCDHDERNIGHACTTASTNRMQNLLPGETEPDEGFWTCPQCTIREDVKPQTQCSVCGFVLHPTDSGSVVDMTSECYTGASSSAAAAAAAAAAVSVQNTPVTAASSSSSSEGKRDLTMSAAGIVEALLRALDYKYPPPQSLPAGATPPPLRYQFCSPLRHISQRGVEGEEWSCGYRNIQMLCLSLMQIPAYRRRLFDGSGKLPGVPEMQSWIERAWADGFDEQGCVELGGVLSGTKTWIGGTECCALLRFFGVNAQVVDFERRSDDVDPVVTKKSRKKKAPDEADNKSGKRRKIEDYLQNSSGAAAVGTVDDAASIGTGVVPVSAGGSESSGNGNPSSNSCIGDRLISWVEDEYFGATRQLWVKWLRENNESNSGTGPNGDAKEEKKTLASLLYLPPVYFQHDGHSRTIVGYEKEDPDNPSNVRGAMHHLYVFDPMCNSEYVLKCLKEYNNGMRIQKASSSSSTDVPGSGVKSVPNKWARFVKRGLHTLKKSAYQVVCVTPGFIDDATEREISKTIVGLKR